ncbi:LADA_0H09098g1_1 [Lachancea dasiensis]|uniref:LADA_0H09098g1_1 n=1 Tax=Lachancea dasiensis TaxID=1072105 RepID=A0A1G4K2M9_9SACH|nr:LADA_0H09098g1_1 [Lachancea dasiensis]
MVQALSSSPQRLPSSPTATAPTRSSFDQSPDSPPWSPEIESITEKLQNERQAEYKSFKQPLSSPLRNGPGSGRLPNCRSRRQSLQAQRHQALEKRALRARGGSTQMERDVLNSERDAEMKLLAAQAQIHHLSPEELDIFDLDGVDDEIDEENEDDEENELIALLQERDDYENMLRLEQAFLEDAMAQISLQD